MIKVYKTNLTTSECVEGLRASLVSSKYSSWNKDVFIGKVRGDRYRFYFHKAYIKNSFMKELTGKIYSQDGDTFVTAATRSSLLSKSTFISVIIFAFISSMFIELLIGFQGDFTAYLRIASLCALIFSTFTLMVGLIVQAIPINKHKKDILLGFLVNTLQLEEYR